MIREITKGKKKLRAQKPHVQVKDVKLFVISEFIHYSKILMNYLTKSTKIFDVYGRYCREFFAKMNSKHDPNRRMIYMIKICLEVFAN